MTSARGRSTPNATASREKIIKAGIAELVENGLTNWTVEEIAKRAECAKGLILYHFQSKTRLLKLVAEEVRYEHTTRLTASLKRSGADALDDLWEAMTEEVSSGAFAMWLALLADRQTTSSATIDAPSRHHLVVSVASALGLQAETIELQQVPTFLDGIQIQVLMGTIPHAGLREQYDGFWLQLLKTPGAG